MARAEQSLAIVVFEECVKYCKNGNDTESVARVTAGFYHLSAPFDRIIAGLQPEIYQRSRFSNEKKSNLTICSRRHTANFVCPLYMVADIY